MLFYFIAAAILPSILGCCRPMKYGGFNHVAGKGHARLFSIDFTQKKVWYKPFSGNIEFSLLDFNVKKEYKKMMDGSCTYSVLTQDLFARCIPDSGINVKTFVSKFGPSTGGLQIKSTSFMSNGQRIVWITTNDGKCHPVMRIGKLSDPGRDVLEFGNITETVDMSVFNQDVSACVLKA